MNQLNILKIKKYNKTQESKYKHARSGQLKIITSKIKYKILVIFLTGLFFACVPQRQSEYMQTRQYQDQKINIYKDIDSRQLEPGDELFIQVYSFNNNISSPVGSETSSQTATPYSSTLQSYKINKDSSIIFPLIGKIVLAGITIQDAETRLKSTLKTYLNSPSVKIKLVNTNISIVGEVAHPGNYPYTNTPINVFQALSLAGDISEYGDRKHVRVIRNNNQNVEIAFLNLTDEDIVKSKYFYLEANDVIYVRPLKRKFWGINHFPFEILISTASVIATIIIAYKVY